MKGFLKIVFVLLTVSFNKVHCQDQPKFKPYTIESTYQKLKNHYPFVTPIVPLVSDKIKARENIVYKKIKSTKLKVDIYLPKDKSKKLFPAVLLIHGGGWLTGHKENERVMAQHLALNGYVAVTASYRLGLKAKYPAGVIDLKDAIVWMRKNAKKYHINPNKIAVLGASAGGQLATLLGVTANSPIYGKNLNFSDAVQAIVNIDGIVSFIHPEAAAESKNGRISMADIWLNGSKEENFKTWKEASPLEYVDKHTPPTLFINSSQPRFRAGRDDMIAILNKFGIHHEEHTIPNSQHSFWLVHPWFETTLNYVVNFLDDVLKDHD